MKFSGRVCYPPLSVIPPSLNPKKTESPSQGMPGHQHRLVLPAFQWHRCTENLPWRSSLSWTRSQSHLPAGHRQGTLHPEHLPSQSPAPGPESPAGTKFTGVSPGIRRGQESIDPASTRPVPLESHVLDGVRGRSQLTRVPPGIQPTSTRTGAGSSRRMHFKCVAVTCQIKA